MFRITIPSSAAKKVLLDLGMALYYNCSCIRIQNIVRKCGGTAYTADLKSAGESLRVQIPPFAPNKHGSLNTKLPCFLLSINPCIIKFFDASSQEISFIVLKLYAHKSKRSDLNPLVFSFAKIIMKHLFLT